MPRCFAGIRQALNFSYNVRPFTKWTGKSSVNSNCFMKIWPFSQQTGNFHGCSRFCSHRGIIEGYSAFSTSFPFNSIPNSSWFLKIQKENMCFTLSRFLFKLWEIKNHEFRHEPKHLVKSQVSWRVTGDLKKKKSDIQDATIRKRTPKAWTRLYR